MKRKSLWTTLASLLMIVFAVFFVSCGGGETKTLTLSKTDLGMNLYDEIVLSVQEDGKITWSSSDETVVKVNDEGLVMAQGVRGDATVTAKMGNASATCNIKVRDRGISPVLETQDARAFVNASTDPVVFVNYNDVQYTPESVSLTSLNEEIVTVENGKLKGVAEGTATLNVSAIWKKATITGEMQVRVYAEQILILGEETIDLYNVADGTKAKQNSYFVDVEAFDKGVAVQNPEITLTAEENGEFVIIQGNSVKVNPEQSEAIENNGETQVKIQVSTTIGGAEVSQTLTMTVHPNYRVMDPLVELTDTKQVKVELKMSETAVDGRENVVDYTIPNDYKNAHASASESTGTWLNNIWANWNTRIEFVSTMTLNGISAYEYLQTEGYKLLSFDVYYQGHKNEKGEWMQSGMFFGTNGASSYFYVDCQNNRDDILIVDKNGAVTNTLKCNEWQTVYFDLDKLITATTIAGKSDCNSFLSMNQVGDVCYIDDVRYWFDTAVLETFENKLDLQERKLIKDTQTEGKAYAPENEFIAFSPVYVTFEKTQFDGVDCYGYNSTKPSGFKVFDEERRNKINAYQDLKGDAVKQGYRYITFDLYVASGAPKIVYYDLFEQKELTFNLTDGTTIASRGLKLFKQTDKKVETNAFETGCWMSVAIRVDGKAKENFFITTKGASLFYLKDVRYYASDAFVYEYSADALLRATPDGINSYYYQGENVELKTVLDVRMAGVKTDEYTILSINGAEDIAEFNSETGTLALVATGKVPVTITLEKDGHTFDVAFVLQVKHETRIEMQTEKAELYGGSEALSFDTSIEVLAKAYEGRVQISEDKLSYEIVSGAEYVTLKDNQVTAKVGFVTGAPVTASVRVYFVDKNGDEISQTVEITLFGAYRQRTNEEMIWGNKTDKAITYSETQEEIVGRTGVYQYYSPNANSWNDRLTVYETAHPISGVGVTVPYANYIEAFNNLDKKNIQYITMDVCFGENSLLRVDAPDKSGKADQRNDYQVGVSVSAVGAKQDNQNVALYYQGQKVTGTVQANVWYTLVIDHETAILGENKWTAVRMTGNGSVYFDNVRYYHDKAWMFDFASEEVLAIVGELENKQFIDDSIEFIPTASWMHETIENAQILITVSDENVVKYNQDTKKLQFLAVGNAIVKASVEHEGRTQEREWHITVNKPLTVDKNAVEMVKGGQETVKATTASTDYELVWKSSDESKVTVENGVLTAVNYGTATVTVNYGDHQEKIEVAVSEYIQKDGSEIVYTTVDGAVGNYGVANETVSGRTGVYKYTSSAKEWTHKLNVKVGGHLNSDNGVARAKSLKEFKAKGYNYVTFDIYFTKGSSAMISSLASETSSVGETYAPNTAITEKNGNIAMYQLGKAVTSVTAGLWYTVVVDYSKIDANVYAQTANVYSRIEIGGILGTIYLDNVRYYSSNAAIAYATAQTYVQSDGSEFVTAKPWSDSTATYGLYDGTVNGRTGVYKWSSTASNWGDKISIKQTHHLSYNTPTYANPTAAATNMKNNGFAYVTFDVCMESGAMIVNTPDSTSTATSLQKYDKVTVGAEIVKGSNLIKYYQVGDNGSYTEVTKLMANTWYTIVIAYDWTVTHTSGSYAGIDLGSLSKANVYIDNVRYYGANPMATANA